MALVPAGRHDLAAVQSIASAVAAARPFLSRLRAHYAARDNWELLAAEDEKREFPGLGLTNQGTSSVSAHMGKKNKKSGGGSRSNSGRGMAPSNRADLAVRPPTYRIPTTIPRQVSNQVVWDVVKTNTTITTSSSALVETNFYWSLNSHPQSSSWATLFDQWCIPQFSATFQCAYPEGASASPGLLYTALDFDSSNNLGSVAALEDYSTCSAAMLVSGQTVTRSVKPCVKGYLAGTAQAGLNRQWIDCALPAIPWYSIRSIVGVCGASYPISVVTTIWFAFRNQI